MLRLKNCSNLLKYKHRSRSLSEKRVMFVYRLLNMNVRSFQKLLQTQYHGPIILVLLKLFISNMI